MGSACCCPKAKEEVDDGQAHEPLLRSESQGSLNGSPSQDQLNEDAAPRDSQPIDLVTQLPASSQAPTKAFTKRQEPGVSPSGVLVETPPAGGFPGPRQGNLGVDDREVTIRTSGGLAQLPTVDVCALPQDPSMMQPLIPPRTILLGVGTGPLLASSGPDAAVQEAQVPNLDPNFSNWVTAQDDRANYQGQLNDQMTLQNMQQIGAYQGTDQSQILTQPGGYPNMTQGTLRDSKTPTIDWSGNVLKGEQTSEQMLGVDVTFQGMDSGKMVSQPRGLPSQDNGVDSQGKYDWASQDNLQGQSMVSPPQAAVFAQFDSQANLPQGGAMMSGASLNGKGHESRRRSSDRIDEVVDTIATGVAKLKAELGSKSDAPREGTFAPKTERGYDAISSSKAVYVDVEVDTTLKSAPTSQSMTKPELDSKKKVTPNSQDQSLQSTVLGTGAQQINFPSTDSSSIGLSIETRTSQVKPSALATASLDTRLAQVGVTGPQLDASASLDNNVIPSTENMSDLTSGLKSEITSIDKEEQSLKPLITGATAGVLSNSADRSILFSQEVGQSTELIVPTTQIHSESAIDVTLDERTIPAASMDVSHLSQDVTMPIAQMPSKSRTESELAENALSGREYSFVEVGEAASNRIGLSTELVVPTTQIPTESSIEVDFGETDIAQKELSSREQILREAKAADERRQSTELRVPTSQIPAEASIEITSGVTDVAQKVLSGKEHILVGAEAEIKGQSTERTLPTMSVANESSFDLNLGLGTESTGKELSGKKQISEADRAETDERGQSTELVEPTTHIPTESSTIGINLGLGTESAEKEFAGKGHIIVEAEQPETNHVVQSTEQEVPTAEIPTESSIEVNFGLGSVKGVPAKGGLLMQAGKAKTDDKSQATELIVPTTEIPNESSIEVNFGLETELSEKDVPAKGGLLMQAGKAKTDDKTQSTELIVPTTEIPNESSIEVDFGLETEFAEKGVPAQGGHQMQAGKAKTDDKAESTELIVPTTEIPAESSIAVNFGLETELAGKGVPTKGRPLMQVGKATTDDQSQSTELIVPTTEIPNESSIEVNFGLEAELAGRGVPAEGELLMQAGKAKSYDESQSTELIVPTTEIPAESSIEINFGVETEITDKERERKFLEAGKATAVAPKSQDHEIQADKAGHLDKEVGEGIPKSERVENEQVDPASKGKKKKRRRHRKKKGKGSAGQEISMAGEEKEEEGRIGAEDTKGEATVSGDEDSDVEDKLPQDSRDITLETSDATLAEIPSIDVQLQLERQSTCPAGTETILTAVASERLRVTTDSKMAEIPSSALQMQLEGRGPTSTQLDVGADVQALGKAGVIAAKESDKDIATTEQRAVSKYEIDSNQDLPETQQVMDSTDTFFATAESKLSALPAVSEVEFQLEGPKSEFRDSTQETSDVRLAPPGTKLAEVFVDAKETPREAGPTQESSRVELAAHEAELAEISSIELELQLQSGVPTEGRQQTSLQIDADAKQLESTKRVQQKTATELDFDTKSQNFKTDGDFGAVEKEEKVQDKKDEDETVLGANLTQESSDTLLAESDSSLAEITPLQVQLQMESAWKTKDQQTSSLELDIGRKGEELTVAESDLVPAEQDVKTPSIELDIGAKASEGDSKSTELEVTSEQVSVQATGLREVVADELSATQEEIAKVIHEQEALEATKAAEMSLAQEFVEESREEVEEKQLLVDTTQTKRIVVELDFSKDKSVSAGDTPIKGSVESVEAKDISLTPKPAVESIGDGQKALPDEPLLVSDSMEIVVEPSLKPTLEGPDAVTEQPEQEKVHDREIADAIESISKAVDDFDDQLAPTTTDVKAMTVAPEINSVEALELEKVMKDSEDTELANASAASLEMTESPAKLSAQPTDIKELSLTSSGSFVTAEESLVSTDERDISLTQSDSTEVGSDFSEDRPEEITEIEAFPETPKVGPKSTVESDEAQGQASGESTVQEISFTVKPTVGTTEAAVQLFTGELASPAVDMKVQQAPSSAMESTVIAELPSDQMSFEAVDTKELPREPSPAVETNVAAELSSDQMSLQAGATKELSREPSPAVETTVSAELSSDQMFLQSVDPTELSREPSPAVETTVAAELSSDQMSLQALDTKELSREPSPAVETTVAVGLSADQMSLQAVDIEELSREPSPAVETTVAAELSSDQMPLQSLETGEQRSQLSEPGAPPEVHISTEGGVEVSVASEVAEVEQPPVQGTVTQTERVGVSIEQTSQVGLVTELEELPDASSHAMSKTLELSYDKHLSTEGAEAAEGNSGLDLQEPRNAIEVNTEDIIREKTLGTHDVLVQESDLQDNKEQVEATVLVKEGIAGMDQDGQQTEGAPVVGETENFMSSVLRKSRVVWEKLGAVSVSLSPKVKQAEGERKTPGEIDVDLNANLQRLEEIDLGVPELDSQYKVHADLFNGYTEKFSQLQTVCHRMRTTYTPSDAESPSLLFVFFTLKDKLGESLKKSGLKLHREFEQTYRIEYEADHVTTECAAIFKDFNTANEMLSILLKAEVQESITRFARNCIENEEGNKAMISGLYEGTNADKYVSAWSKLVGLMWQVIPCVSYMRYQLVRFRDELESSALVLFTQEEEKERVEQDYYVRRTFLESDTPEAALLQRSEFVTQVGDVLKVVVEQESVLKSGVGAHEDTSIQEPSAVLDEAVAEESTKPVEQAMERDGGTETIDQERGAEVPTDSIEQEAATDSIEQILAADSIEQVAATDSIEQVLASDSIEQVLATDSIEQVLPTDSIEQVLSADSIEQVLASDSIEQVVTVDSTEQLEAMVPIEQEGAPETGQEAVIPVPSFALSTDVELAMDTIEQVIQRSSEQLPDEENEQTIAELSQSSASALQINFAETAQEECEGKTPITGAEEDLSQATEPSEQAVVTCTTELSDGTTGTESTGLESSVIADTLEQVSVSASSEIRQAVVGKEGVDVEPSANLQRLEAVELGVPELDAQYQVHANLFNGYNEKFTQLQTCFSRMRTTYTVPGVTSPSLLLVFFTLKRNLAESPDSDLKLNRQLGQTYRIDYEADHVTPECAAILNDFNTANETLSILLRTEDAQNVMSFARNCVETEEENKLRISEIHGDNSEQYLYSLSKLVALMWQVIPCVTFMRYQLVRFRDELESSALVLFTPEEKERVEEDRTLQRNFLDSVVTSACLQEAQSVTTKGEIAPEAAELDSQESPKLDASAKTEGEIEESKGSDLEMPKADVEESTTGLLLIKEGTSAEGLHADGVQSSLTADTFGPVSVSVSSDVRLVVVGRDGRLDMDLANLQRLEEIELGVPELDGQYEVHADMYNGYTEKFTQLQTCFSRMRTTYTVPGVTSPSLLLVFFTLKQNLGDSTESDLQLLRQSGQTYRIGYEADHVTAECAAILNDFNHANKMLSIILTSEDPQTVINYARNCIETEKENQNIISGLYEGETKDKYMLTLSKLVGLMWQVIPCVSYMRYQLVRFRDELESSALVLFTQEEEKERVEQDCVVQRAALDL